MTVESRGRRAGSEFRRAIDDLGSSAPERRSVSAFERARSRRLRNRRIGAGLLAAAVSMAGVVLLIRAFTLDRRTPGAPVVPSGAILFGDWDERTQQADWYTVVPDGTGLEDLHVNATCATWLPDGSRILITNDAAVGSRRPLRPALVEPDGSDLRPLDATRNPDLHLGCGDMSPDGTTIALEGFGRDGHPELNGIYSIRSSDGGGLTRLVEGPVSPPRFSPDGTRLSFFDTKAGVSPPGSGALFVMGADGADPVRITPWGYAFMDHAWSPDGSRIAFQRPFGQLYLVRPDGSDLERIPLDLPQGAGALNPSWSPDGSWIVLSLQRQESAEIYMVRPDGTGLRKVSESTGAELYYPDWGTPPG